MDQEDKLEGNRDKSEKEKKKGEKRITTGNGSVTNWRICEVMMEDKDGGDEVRYHLTGCSLERFLCQGATFHCPQFVAIKPYFFPNSSLPFCFTPSAWFISISLTNFEVTQFFSLQVGFHLSVLPFYVLEHNHK